MIFDIFLVTMIIILKLLKKIKMFNNYNLKDANLNNPTIEINIQNQETKADANEKILEKEITIK